MPQSEHAQPVEGERQDNDDSNRAKEQRRARDESRPEDGRDYWRAGQHEDETAGDEGIDDGIMRDDFDEPTLDDAFDVRTEDDREQLGAAPRADRDDAGVDADVNSVPDSARRNDINDKTR